MKLDEVKRNESKNIALIEWYDFKSETNPYIYGCSYLKLTEILNIVDIEAIRDTIHIIPRFNKTNEYFVNKFIF
jgi:predicted transcriptional regulator